MDSKIRTFGAMFYLFSLVLLHGSPNYSSKRSTHFAKITSYSKHEVKGYHQLPHQNWLSSFLHSSHQKLARLTAYWSGEDHWTEDGQSSTGIHLRSGCCAVDPDKIPYGSIITIPGYGKFVAVDTGTAVINRIAARKAGKTSEERNALVVDIYFANRREGKNFASLDPKFVDVSWNEPVTTGNVTVDWSQL